MGRVKNTSWLVIQATTELGNGWGYRCNIYKLQLSLKYIADAMSGEEFIMPDGMERGSCIMEVHLLHFIAQKGGKFANLVLKARSKI